MARASERPAIRPWVESAQQCAQRPTPNRKSGNTQLQEAPSCFEAEVMEEDRVHSGLQTHGHVGLGALACQGTLKTTQRAACSRRFFLRGPSGKVALA